VRFLLGNLSDYDPSEDRLPKEDILEIDRWAIFKLSKLIREVTAGYEEYQFYHVFQKIYGFCNEEMSSLYLDVLKDRLYTAGKKSKSRRSAQTVLYEILDSLTKLLAPVLSFTCDEIYRFYQKEKTGSFENVHLSSWPQMKKEYMIKEEEVEGIEKVLSFRSAVLKALEDKRAKGEIGSALEAKVILAFKEEKTYKVFTSYLEQLPFVFIVSQVEVQKRDDLASDFSVTIHRADGRKCSRCWNYTMDVDTFEKFPGVCGRCVAAIK
jgi:isoleucyl-tRNA synthetase